MQFMQFSATILNMACLAASGTLSKGDRMVGCSRTCLQPLALAWASHGLFEGREITACMKMVKLPFFVKTACLAASGTL